jgi:hypothetical protein
MNKRGQFYIVIALILSMTIYGVTYRVNTIEEPKVWEDFNKVSENYITQTAIVINGALKNKNNVSKNLNNFSASFLGYAQERNPNLGLLYIYSNGEDLTVRNYLDETGAVGNQTVFGTNQELVQDVTIRIGGKDFIYKIPVTSENFGEDWSSATMGNDPFNLSIAGIIHPFDLSGGNPEFKVIIRSESGGILGEETYGTPGEEWNPSLSPNIQQLVS